MLRTGVVQSEIIIDSCSVPPSTQIILKDGSDAAFVDETLQESDVIDVVGVIRIDVQLDQLSTEEISQIGLRASISIV